MSTFFVILFFAVPAISSIILLVSLSLFFGAKADNKKHPGCHAEKQIKRYKLVAIVSGIVTGAFVLIFLGMIGLLYLAVAFM